MRIFCFVLRAWASALAVGLLVAAAPSAVASNEGHAAADQVSVVTYSDYMENYLYTHPGDSRGPSGAEHDLARDNIFSLFQSFGLDVQLEAFSYYGDTYYNVVATKTGSEYPNQEYIIGAHYDTVSNPGADDNASGVCLVLEAARILCQYRSDYTIRFIAFDMEEVGLVGSEAYVAAHDTDDILGMISADMVAYDPDTNHCNVYGKTASNPIKNTLAAAVAEYGAGLSYTIGGDTPYSDHAPFEDGGYQACLLIEGEVWSNPYYHTQDDHCENMSNLNYPYAIKMTRSMVGWLVDQAGVDVPVNTLDFVYPDGLPEYVSPSGGTSFAVEVVGIGTEVPQEGTGVFHYDAGLGWQTVPMTEVSPNVYEAVFPAAACGEEIAYYVSAEAVGGQPYTDPRQAPTVSYSAVAGYGFTVYLEEPLDSDPGWITEGQWAFGVPTGGGGAYGGPDPTSGHTGDYVYGYNLSGDYTNSMQETHLTSQAIDCTGLYQGRLSFWRWLGVEQPSYDHAYVRISNNGTDWVTLWENAAEVADTEWIEMEFDISAYADNQPTVYLRWTMGTTDYAWTYCGWNIDDIQISGLECTSALGDFDVDGDVDLNDFATFALCYAGAEVTVAPPGCGPEDFDATDMDEDGDVDLSDFATFATRFTG
ncbi:MAG: M28 family peptidase [Phycisphaerales bacterium]|nr:MAG: M28 family peptidase [Phycisphaerales bacterium]